MSRSDPLLPDKVFAADDDDFFFAVCGLLRGVDDFADPALSDFGVSLVDVFRLTLTTSFWLGAGLAAAAGNSVAAEVAPDD